MEFLMKVRMALARFMQGRNGPDQLGSFTLIAGIVRDRTPIIPGGDDMILPGDHVVVISSELRLNELTDILR